MDGLLKAYLSKVEFDGNRGQFSNPPVGCNTWSGLIEFAVEENGNYLATVPFEQLNVNGAPAAPDLLIYDGIGGTCRTPQSNAILNIRVTTLGQGPGGATAQGSAVAAIPYIGGFPHPAPAEYSVPVDVPVPGSPNPARLWFRFMVGNMC